MKETGQRGLIERVEQSTQARSGELSVGELSVVSVEKLEMIESEDAKILIFAGCPKIEVIIASHRYEVLLDNEAEIYLIFKKTVIEWSLGINFNIFINLNGVVLGNSARFLDVCENVSIIIKGIVIPMYIFVISGREHKLILGTLYNRAAHIFLTYKFNGSCEIMIYIRDRLRGALFLVFFIDNLRC